MLVLNGVPPAREKYRASPILVISCLHEETAECGVIKRNNNCRGFQFPGFSVSVLRSFVSSGWRVYHLRTPKKKETTTTVRWMDEDKGGPGCAVVSRRKRKRDEEGEERAASPLCRHSSPLTFTSSTSDGGQILIQLGRINQITMASPLPSPELSSVASSRHESLPPPISIEHTLSWNNR